MHARTAAHRHAPFGTWVEVRNLDNGRTTSVRINDRGPFVRGRVIDLSYQAAKDIGLVGAGTARVQLSFQGKKAERSESSGAPSPRVRAEPSEDESTFVVQIGSFGDPGNAQRLLDEVRQRYPEDRWNIQAENGYHRVVLGPEPSREGAETLADQIRALGYPTVVLRR